jgi:peroxiredoxin/predicted 2-oxoglutarate/Fe(II)-dependent dioxygenase YbiX
MIGRMSAKANQGPPGQGGNQRQEPARQGGRLPPGMPPFEVRDLLPDIILPKEDGRFVRVSFEMSGRMLLLLFCPDPRLPACREMLAEFAAAADDLEPFVHCFVVTGSGPEANRAFLEETPLPFLVLSDLKGEVARALAVGHNLAPATGDGSGEFSLLLADANRRITRIERGLAGQGRAAELVEDLRGLPAPAPRQLGRFAPVLYVPDVLEPELCRSLIAAWEAGEPEVGRTYVHDSRDGDYVVDPKFKVRRDFYVTDPALVEALRLRLLRRVFPEIRKALTREVTGLEEFKVVCYDAAEGGHFTAHRDNVSKHYAHRRFAMTLNLNAGEYEGGELRFPEYGPDLYAPDAGDAVVFSCSLLHEARPVTRGRRFVLLSFLFDEESRLQNDRFRRLAGASGPGGGGPGMA